MKRVASILALAALVAALTAGAGAQQQTFYTAHAGATGPPTPTAPPMNIDIYTYGCGGQGGGHNPKPYPSGHPLTATTQHGGNPCNNGHRPTPRPSGRPSGRPSPRPTR